MPEIPVLQMKQIVKKFGDLVANDHIDLALNSGEILAVIGENGAGKTTLMKILYGLEQPDSGEILIHGKPVQIKNPAHAIELGIGMVQQHFMLFDPFTVAENVVYGKEPKRGIFFDTDKANRTVAELSQKYELPLHPQDKIQGMPVGLRQRVEILKVLYQNTEIIIFDEPTAVLTPQEVKELLSTMKHLAAMGKHIIIITHKLAEVMEVADRAMIMRAGKLIGNYTISETTIELLSFEMVGRQIVEKQMPPAKTGDAILVIKDLCMENDNHVGMLNNLSLHINAGEIVGIAGVSGNGQTELAQGIFGLMKTASGSIRVCGEEIRGNTTAEIRDKGVSMIPEDRYLWGSAKQATLVETAIMGHYKKPEFSKHGILNIPKMEAFTERLIKDFSVKAEDIHEKTGSLSGGNAQKLIAAREIEQHTPLLIAFEPTRGVDIGAMEFLHNQLIAKRSEGSAVLLISSELSEIMKLSDRIYVIYDGSINGEFVRGNVHEEELGLLMAGGAEHETKAD